MEIMQFLAGLFLNLWECKALDVLAIQLTLCLGYIYHEWLKMYLLPNTPSILNLTYASSWALIISYVKVQPLHMSLAQGGLSPPLLFSVYRCNVVSRMETFLMAPVMGDLSACTGRLILSHCTNSEYKLDARHKLGRSRWKDWLWNALDYHCKRP